LARDCPGVAVEVRLLLEQWIRGVRHEKKTEVGEKSDRGERERKREGIKRALII
jgi:hypothetical protein